MRNYRIKTKLACEFARVDRQQLADAIAAGLYTCAPPTSRGSSRIFEVDDVVALFIFGRLSKLGFVLSRAAEIACEMHYEFKTSRAHAELDQKPLVTLMGGLNGISHIAMCPRSVPEAVSGLGIVFENLGFDVPVIREHINALAEHEANTLGEDDE